MTLQVIHVHALRNSSTKHLYWLYACVVQVTEFLLYLLVLADPACFLETWGTQPHMDTGTDGITGQGFFLSSESSFHFLLCEWTWLNSIASFLNFIPYPLPSISLAYALNHFHLTGGKNLQKLSDWFEGIRVKDEIYT